LFGGEKAAHTGGQKTKNLKNGQNIVYFAHFRKFPNSRPSALEMLAPSRVLFTPFVVGRSQGLLGHSGLPGFFVLQDDLLKKMKASHPSWVGLALVGGSWVTTGSRWTGRITDEAGLTSRAGWRQGWGRLLA
jgi:hypothetical protein